MRRTAAGSALLLVALLSCARDAGTDRVVLLALADGLARAEVAWELDELDFGAPGASRYLLGGWSWPEGAPNGSAYRWSNGDESALELYLATVRPLPVRLRCQPFTLPGAPRQRLRLAVNGEPAAELEL